MNVIEIIIPCVIVCDFPEDYVKNNFEQAYVQVVLTYMAYMEEFKEDFCNIPSAELLQYMTQAEDFYADYITYKELCMKTVTEDYLMQQIKWYVGDDIPESEMNSVISYITGRKILK